MADVSGIASEALARELRRRALETAQLPMRHRDPRRQVSRQPAAK